MGHYIDEAGLLLDSGFWNTWPLGIINLQPDEDVFCFCYKLFKIVEQLTHKKLDLDDTIDENAKNIWDRWYSILTALSVVTIPRCVILGLQNDSQKELHVFCDGSQFAYAAVAYLKITDKTGSFKTQIVMGKS